ncbi:hypothetical protein QBC45DRAFT_418315 [Copromyces sp. CBS 386.78]|nr:hypothetical protein QBC45DRAFT_418315 [Copromyces sp. CBS 386.78]
MGRKDRNPAWREANIWEKHDPPRRYSIWATITRNPWGTHDADPDPEAQIQPEPTEDEDDPDPEAQIQPEPNEHEDEEGGKKTKKKKKRSIWRPLACGMKFPKMGWSFGRKKNKEGAAENPYAQQPAADPYANQHASQHASPAQSQATLSSTTSNGPHPGGLPSGPSPYQNNQAPPPYSAGGPVQQPPAAGRYTNDRFGTTDRYGDNRYDTPSTSNQNRYEPSIDSKQSQLYSSSKYSSGVSAGPSAQPSPTKQQYPVTYGDNKQPGQIQPDGPTKQQYPVTYGDNKQPGQIQPDGIYQPSPQEIYGNKFGVPEEELDEEQKQDLEVDRTKEEILRTHNENTESLQRSRMHMQNVKNLGANIIENLSVQGDRLDKIHDSTIRIELKTKTAQDTTGYLGKLNDRPFFVPAMSKKSLRLMDEKTYMDQTEEKMERQKERAIAFQNQQSIQNMKPGQKKLLGGKAVKNYMAFEDDVTEKDLNDLTYEDDDGQQQAMLKQQKKMEKELYCDLVDMKNIAHGIGQVLERQTGQIGAIAENVDRADDRTRRTNVKLNAMLR